MWIENPPHQIESALSLPGTGWVQTLEGGVTKFILHCFVSETVINEIVNSTFGAVEISLLSVGGNKLIYVFIATII